jgi:hypothetical protein
MAAKKREFRVVDLVIPVWKAILAVAVYAIVVLLLILLNRLIGSDILESTLHLLLQLLYIVFILAVISSYAGHFKRISNVSFIAPGLDALSSALIIYFLAVLMLELNADMSIWLLDAVGNFLLDNILLLFFAMLALSYIFWLAGRSSES